MLIWIGHTSRATGKQYSDLMGCTYVHKKKFEQPRLAVRMRLTKLFMFLVILANLKSPLKEYKHNWNGARDLLMEVKIMPNCYQTIGK